MASLNKVFLMGNLTRPPQSRALQQTGVPLCDMGMAINRRYKTTGGEEREEVIYVDLTAYGHQADYCAKNMAKGMPIYVEGHLRYDTWQDKDTGKNRSKLRVVVDNIFPLERKFQQGGDQTAYPAAGYGQPAPPPAYGQSYQPAYGLPPQHPATMPYQPPNAIYSQPHPPALQPATQPQTAMPQPPATVAEPQAAVQTPQQPVQPVQPATQSPPARTLVPSDDSPPPETDEIADDLPF